MEDKSLPRYYIGTSGWHYEHWRGLYYPEGLPKSKWLQFYARQFNTVELNNSFYHLPSEKAFSTWRDFAPDNFVFAVKVSRFITHIKRLKNLGSAVENFLSRATFLQNKLGPLLYQLPPNMKRNDEILRISSLPCHSNINMYLNFGMNPGLTSLFFVFWSNMMLVFVFSICPIFIVLL